MARVEFISYINRSQMTQIPYVSVCPLHKELLYDTKIILLHSFMEGSLSPYVLCINIDFFVSK